MSGRHSRLPWFLVLGAGAVLGFGPVACVGRGYYGGPYDYPGGAAAAVAIADLNGDGKPDLVSTNPGTQAGSGFLSVQLQAPGQPGGFQGPIRSFAGGNPGNLAVASLGGSAGPSAVVVNGQVAVNPSAANTVSVLRPNGVQPGAFLAPVTLPLGTRNPVDVAMGDNSRLVEAQGAHGDAEAVG
jgi:hypothetical protein